MTDVRRSWTRGLGRSLANCISIIVPVYNDPNGIRRTISSLIDLSYSSEGLEIVIVDNASTDVTPVVIRELSSEYDIVRDVVEGGVQGSYAARNTGIRAAKGDTIAFVDSNTYVDREWLSGALEAMMSGGFAYMATKVELTTEPGHETLAGRYNQRTGFPIEQYVGRHRYAPTCCLFVTRDLFEDVGLFDPRLVSSGDLEFGNRVDGAGYELGYFDGVTLYHPARTSLAELYAKNVRIGRGQAQLQRYYPRRYGRPPIPPRHPPIQHQLGDIPPLDRLLFRGVSTTMSAVRATGYAREVVDPTDNGADVDGPPAL